MTTPATNPQTLQWQAVSRDHHLAPFGDYQQLSDSGPRIITKADGVICGFGRTGEWFGSDYYGNQPDLMTIGKGLTSGYIPMGGLVVSDKIVEVLKHGGDFNHGFTYSGHPVAAALENIRILRDEKIIQRVREETAPYLQMRLRELADHPLVGEVRGVGMLGAIELVKNKQTRERFAGQGALMP
jgi:putrescine aminotransferase